MQRHPNSIPKLVSSIAGSLPRLGYSQSRQVLTDPIMAVSFLQSLVSAAGFHAVWGLDARLEFSHIAGISSGVLESLVNPLLARRALFLVWGFEVVQD